MNLIKRKQRKSELHPNPIGPLLWLTIAAIVLATISIIFFILTPSSLPMTYEETTLGEPLVFDSLSFHRYYLLVHIENGVMIPIENRGQVTGVLFLGDGYYEFIPSGKDRTRLESLIGLSSLTDTFLTAYLKADYPMFEDLRYQARAVPSPTPELHLAQAENYLTKAKPGGSNSLLAGSTSDWYTMGVGYTASFYGNQYGKLTYSESQELLLTFEDLNLVVPLPNPGSYQEGSYAPLGTTNLVPQAIAIYLSIIFMFIILINVLTIDLEKVRPKGFLNRRVPNTDRLILLLFILAEATFYYFTLQGFLTEQGLYVLHGVAILVLAYRLFRQRLIVNYIGISFKYFGRGIIIGILLGFLGFIAQIMAVPYGIKITDFSVLFEPFLISFFLIGLLGELFYRGYLQTTMERLFGPKAGLIFTSLIIGLIYLVPHLYVAGLQWWPTFLEGILVIPSTALVFGYLYQRTGSIIPGVIARTLLELLPLIFLF